MRDEHRFVRVDTVDKLCIRLDLHPVLLPDSVSTAWRPRRLRDAA